MKDEINLPPTSCRAYEIMRMMCCVRGQSSVSQMKFLLHDSIRLQGMGSNPYTSCCMYETMRVNECVVEQKCTTLKASRLYYSLFLHFVGFMILCVVL